MRLVFKNGPFKGKSNAELSIGYIIYLFIMSGLMPHMIPKGVKLPKKTNVEEFKDNNVLLFLTEYKNNFSQILRRFTVNDINAAIKKYYPVAASGSDNKGDDNEKDSIDHSDSNVDPILGSELAIANLTNDDSACELRKQPDFF